MLYQNHHINLSNINLSNINLSNINLSNINLSNINLSNINLSNINLSNINLSTSAHNIRRRFLPTVNSNGGAEPPSQFLRWGEAPIGS